MRCNEIQEQIVLMHYGELDGEQLLEVEAHLRDCAACQEEMATTGALLEGADSLPMVDPSPNLLAQSRVRLDEALDALGPRGPLEQMRSHFFRWMGNLQSAPALATLLVGVGFLGGSLVHRQPPVVKPGPVVLTDPTHGAIVNVSGIVQTPNSELVQVKYNRIIPESVEGSLDEPQIRQLLLMGMRAGTNSDVRSDSVSLLASECRSGHRCGSTGKDDPSSLRGALMVSLRYDKDPGVRLKALEGLQHFVDQDQRVRDAMLEALLHDGSAAVRKRAITMLEPVESDSSVRQVLRTVSAQDENPYIRTVSYQALQSADGIQ